MMLGDYVLILSFYFLLAFTGIFAFTEINDLYTLNFQVSAFLGMSELYINGIFQPSSTDSWFLFSLHSSRGQIFRFQRLLHLQYFEVPLHFLPVERYRPHNEGYLIYIYSSNF